MDFSFGKLDTVPVAGTESYLKAYNIYNEVSIKSITLKSGNKQDGGTWKAIEIVFACKEGIHNEMMFLPDHTNKKDTERPQFDSSNGGKTFAPSACENFVSRVMNIVSIFAPTVYDKFRETYTKCKSFDDVANIFIKVIEANKGKVTTSMKLVGKKGKDKNGNERINRALPKPLGIMQKSGTVGDKEEDWETFSIRCFGENLTFTPYELGQKEKYESAKPTDMSKVDDSLGVDTPEEVTTDIDLSALAGL